MHRVKGMFLSSQRYVPELLSIEQATLHKKVQAAQKYEYPKKCFFEPNAVFSMQLFFLQNFGLSRYLHENRSI